MANGISKMLSLSSTGRREFSANVPEQHNANIL
jgi:hypothetical protein